MGLMTLGITTQQSVLDEPWLLSLQERELHSGKEVIREI
ncbi:hypothetical protein IFVP5_C2270020 [Vibrio parahaemolyticus]